MPVPDFTPYAGLLPSGTDPATFSPRATALFTWFVETGAPQLAALATYLDGILEGDEASMLEALASRVTLDTAQDISGNKRFAGARLTGAYTVLAPAVSVTPDLSATNRLTLTLDRDLTLQTPTGGVAGQGILLVLEQDGAGDHLVSWGSGWLFPGGEAPELSIAAGAVDVIVGEVIAPGTVVASAVLDFG